MRAKFASLKKSSEFESLSYRMSSKFASLKKSSEFEYRTQTPHSNCIVELAGFEPASRQAINELSTCVVLFDFRPDSC